MWLSSKIFSILEVAKSSVDNLYCELAAVRAERDVLKTELISSKNNFDWLRLRVNVLEVERAQLLEKAYGIKTIVPELVRPSTVSLDMNTALFEDMGDDKAREQGLPVYGN